MLLLSAQRWRPTGNTRVDTGRGGTPIRSEPPQALPLSLDFPARTRATSLLRSAHSGDADTLARLVPLIYGELRGMAHRQLAREGRGGPPGAGRTLQTTELVHEAYLKLVDETQVTSRGRAYFFAAAANAMRQVLIDRARRRRASKRGSGRAALSLDEGSIAVDTFADELVSLDDALGQLATISERQARVVECRYFGGLTVEETAEALGVSPRTVKSDWALARAWLHNVLRGSGA